MAAPPTPPPAAAGAPPSAQVVGNAFVQQYYLVLHQSPDLVHRFYQDSSRLGRPSSGAAGDMDSITTMEAINEKIMAMDMTRAEIRTVDSQESLGGGVTVLVTGHLTSGDGVRREFSQSFFLAPQEKGYFVLNDMFRYVGEDPAPAAVAEAQAEAETVVPPAAAPLANGTTRAVVEPSPPEQDSPSQREQHVVEHTPVQPEEEEEVYNPPPEDAQGPAVDEEQPVPEVIDEVPNNVAPVMAITTAPVPHEEAPKKSYASIVKVMKETPPPAPAHLVRPAPPKPEKQHPAPVADVPPFNSNNDSSSIQEPEVDAHAIYVRNLPLNATPAQLADEFKKFGTIKPDGIQVRSHKVQGFCYGFVEFEESTAVQTAIEALSVMIGGRQCYIEEKRTPGSRGSGRGRFAPGRGNSFRTEGMRGRGNYGGGRSFGRGDFRTDYGGRNGRGGSGRGADGSYNHSAGGGRGGRTSAGTGSPTK